MTVTLPQEMPEDVILDYLVHMKQDAKKMFQGDSLDDVIALCAGRIYIDRADEIRQKNDLVELAVAARLLNPQVVAVAARIAASETGMRFLHTGQLVVPPGQSPDGARFN